MYYSDAYIRGQLEDAIKWANGELESKPGDASVQAIKVQALCGLIELNKKEE